MNNINITDEGLRIIYLDRSATQSEESASQEMGYVLFEETNIVMSSDKKNELLSRLEEVAFSKSFGQILDSKIRQTEITIESLAQETKLPLSIIDELLGDKIYTNNVPIVMIKNLLTKLQISFSTAEKGIKKTFELLQNNIVEQTMNFKQVPAFRKGIYLPKEVAGSQQGTDGRELYENKESLEKYIKRLNELLK